MRVTLLLLSYMFMLWPCALYADNARYAVQIHTNAQPIMAMAWGDFDETHAGDELVCLMSDRSVMALYPDESGWTSNILFEPYKEYPLPLNPRNHGSISVGNIMTAQTGNEIAVDLGRELIAIHRDEDFDWTHSIVEDFSSIMGKGWGAEVGDCDPAHPGDEIFYVYESAHDLSSGTVFGESNGVWTGNIVYNAQVGMDSAIGDSNPDHGGNEIVVVTEMGPAYEIQPPANDEPWTKRKIWNDVDNAGWVVKIGDVEPDQPGNELVYGTRYSNSIMLSRYNGTNMHPVEVLFTGSAGSGAEMMDIAIGNLVQSSATMEVLGVDETGSVYLVQKTNETWYGSTIWQDPKALYTIVAADILPDFPGDETIVAGESGAITLLLDPRVMLNITGTGNQQVVCSWTSVTGLAYSVETATNLLPNTAWTTVTNLIYRDAFLGTLSYTNTVDTSGRFFRQKVLLRDFSGKP